MTLPAAALKGPRESDPRGLVSQAAGAEGCEPREYGPWTYISIDIWVHGTGGLALCHNRLNSTVPADPVTPESLQSNPLATLVVLFLQFVHAHWLGHS